jgi:hypothetical protein
VQLESDIVVIPVFQLIKVEDLHYDEHEYIYIITWSAWTTFELIAWSKSDCCDSLIQHKKKFSTSVIESPSLFTWTCLKCKNSCSNQNSSPNQWLNDLFPFGKDCYCQIIKAVEHHKSSRTKRLTWQVFTSTIWQKCKTNDTEWMRERTVLCI